MMAADSFLILSAIQNGVHERAPSLHSQINYGRKSIRGRPRADLGLRVEMPQERPILRTCAANA